MKNSSLFLVSLALLFTNCSNQTDEAAWYLKANYYEGCSCNAPCPCPFGLPMTNSYCNLNAFVDIQEGEYKGINLSGLQIVISGSVGAQGDYIFTESITDEQQQALETLLKVINPASFKTVKTIKKESLEFKKEKHKVSFSSSEIKVELQMVLGKNNKPVRFENLKNDLFLNYIPYLSILNTRTCKDTSSNFSIPQKAGFSSYWDLEEKDFNSF